MALRLRPNVLRMKPYSPGKPIDEVERELGLESVIKLASNENPYGPSPMAVEAVRRAADAMNFYPDATGHVLKEALAARHGVRQDQILLGNGSDELIHLLTTVFLEPDRDDMIVGDPSFVRYDAGAELAGSRLTKVPATPAWRLDIPAMARAVTPDTKLVFIANPNNPTGTYATRDELREFLDAAPEGVVTVLDEAYFEFAEPISDYPDGLEFVRAGKPVVVLRTFSKAYGMAGIRLGYGVAPAEIVDAVNRAREPFNVNSLAQAAALAALGDREHLERTLRGNAEQMQRLVDGVQALGLTVIPSCTNFLCIDLKRPSQPVFERLLQSGVIVRGGHTLGMPNFIRVTVGTGAEVDRFLSAFSLLVREEVPA